MVEDTFFRKCVVMCFRRNVYAKAAARYGFQFTQEPSRFPGSSRENLLIVSYSYSLPPLIERPLSERPSSPAGPIQAPKPRVFQGMMIDLASLLNPSTHDMLQSGQQLQGPVGGV